MTRLTTVAALALMWAALWQDVSAGTLAAGVVAATLVVLVTPDLRAPVWRPFGRPAASLHFLAAFCWNLVRATAVMAWEVLTPRNRIRQGIVAVPLRTRSHAIVAVVANAVTLTPGTVTVDVRRDPPALYVHVLHLRDIARAREEVQRLEDLAIRAFGSEEEVRAMGEERA